MSQPKYTVYKQNPHSTYALYASVINPMIISASVVWKESASIVNKDVDQLNWDTITEALGNTNE